MYLTVGEDSENVQLRIRSKALTLPHAGYNSSHKGAMAQTYKHKCNVVHSTQNLCGHVTYAQTFAEIMLQCSLDPAFPAKNKLL